MDSESKRRHSEADEAERFVNEFSDGIAGDIVEDNTLVFDSAPTDEEIMRRRIEEERLDEERKNDAKRSAEELVESAKKLYGSNISDLDYVKFKTMADINSFTKILYQIETNEEAIRMVMQDLRDVTGAARLMMFKNLSDLQETEMKLLAAKSKYLVSLEASLKQISNDVEMDSAIEVEAPENGGQVTAKMKGGRELNRMMEQAMESMGSLPPENGTTNQNGQI